MNLKTLRFARLTEAYIEPILAIEAEWNTSPWSAKSFTNELTNPQSVFLVMLVDSAVVGYGGIWNLVDESHITTLAIAKEARSQKLGRKLVEELLQGAEKAGMLHATLEVRAGNTTAINLYKKLGFQEVAVRKKYYPDNQEDAIVMWLYDLAERNRDTSSE